MLAALSVIGLKASVEIFQSAALEPAGESTGQLKHPLFWCIVVGTLCMAILDMMVIQAGLNFFDTVFFMPIYSSALIVCGALSGVFMLGDGDNMDKLNIVFFSLGLAICFGGTMYVSSASSFARFNYHLVLSTEISVLLFRCARARSSSNLKCVYTRLPIHFPGTLPRAKRCGHRIWHLG